MLTEMSYEHEIIIPGIEIAGDFRTYQKIKVGDDFAAYSQHVTVEYVDNTNFTQVDATPDSNNRFIRVTVKIYCGTKEISSASWIRAQY